MRRYLKFSHHSHVSRRRLTLVLQQAARLLESAFLGLLYKL